MAKSSNLVKQFSNFTRTSAGLEKTLRLLQAAAQIATETTVDQVSALRCGQARSQFALTRRFFRFFNFIDCFERVFGLLGGNLSDGFLLLAIELVRWSCLGLYFLLEDLTILHAMNIYPVPWNKPVLVEAYKFWFYALSLSIVSSLWRLVFSAEQPATTKQSKGEKAKAATKQASAVKEQRHALVKRIVIDGCDLLIPGTFVGWIEASDLTVAIGMVVIHSITLTPANYYPNYTNKMPLVRANLPWMMHFSSNAEDLGEDHLEDTTEDAETSFLYIPHSHRAAMAARSSSAGRWPNKVLADEDQETQQTDDTETRFAYVEFMTERHEEKPVILRTAVSAVRQSSFKIYPSRVTLDPRKGIIIKVQIERGLDTRGIWNAVGTAAIARLNSLLSRVERGSSVSALCTGVSNAPATSTTATATATATATQPATPMSRSHRWTRARGIGAAAILLILLGWTSLYLYYHSPVRHKLAPNAHPAPAQPAQTKTNFTRTLVIARTHDADTSWVDAVAAEDPLLDPVVYTVDIDTTNATTPTVSQNKGHEVMVYLTYIIDHYFTLHDITLFMHADRLTWHNNDLLDLDSARMVRRLRSEYVAARGYANLRCQHDPGCPAHVRLDPDSAAADGSVPEAAVLGDAWRTLFPEDAVPSVLAQPCCSQFAVSAETVRRVPLLDYVAYRRWLLETELDDLLSGRVWEYLWQWVFMGRAQECPDERMCYCAGYGVCLGEGEYAEFFRAQDEARRLEGEMHDGDVESVRMQVDALHRRMEEIKSMAWGVEDDTSQQGT
ncbi:hypothetical protein ATEIFO6365_0007032600 [Aspergillus terreus]|uniref:Uncharacterized protein n=1 Tax=Aspergillus terreus TaxID=33178 RepID=A0A5M3Z4J4_ASPTE|nr:hypothetical protein ATETN484_0009032600 [Aspergillus terreus]GFF17777.1 hypothetical protein ATEIFO6365_0007032600 [Aspergillus terreus]